MIHLGRVVAIVLNGSPLGAIVDDVTALLRDVDDDRYRREHPRPDMSAVAAELLRRSYPMPDLGEFLDESEDAERHRAFLASRSGPPTGPLRRPLPASTTTTTTRLRWQVRRRRT